MKKSFRTKLVLMFVTEIIGCMMLMILLSEIFMEPLFINDSKSSMRGYGETVSQALYEGRSDISHLLESINTAYGIRTTVLSEDYQVLYSEKGDSVSQGLDSAERLRTWLIEDARDQAGQVSYYKKRYDKEYKFWRLFYILRTEDDKFIIMSKAIRGIEQDAQLVTIFITIMGISIAVIGGLTWSFLTKPITDQMAKMSRVTHNMSVMKFDEKISYRSQDEIGVLAESIDLMSEKLKESVEFMQQELERRKSLIRNISHELRTPITTIRGYAENAQIVAHDNERIVHYCNIMIDECDMLESLVSEMLEMSKLESGEYIGEMERIQSTELIADIQAQFYIEFPKYSLGVKAETGMLRGNSLLLSRALMNYLRNAVRYGENEVIWIHGYTREGYYRIEVTNDGDMISEEEQNRIWEVFYKKDQSRQRDGNHGVGLAIVQEIANLHRGKVGVACMDGKVTFWLDIPSFCE